VQPACLNCDRGIDPDAVYCSRLCRDTVEVVRFGRSVVATGHLVEPSVLAVLEVRLATLLQGGYPQRDRRLPTPLRREVLERDGGICQSCGQAFASQVDRVAEAGPDSERFRGVCDSCHRRFLESLVPTASRDASTAEAIRQRIHAPEPLQPCDDHLVWGRHW
jgi:5-methylcytosine-specific restriction endonuclease McrA